MIGAAAPPVDWEPLAQPGAQVLQAAPAWMQG